MMTYGSSALLAWTIRCTSLVALLLVPFAAIGGDPRKIAVLISTELATTVETGPPLDTLAFNEYWNDLVLTHETVKLNGFTDDNIYMLYAKGNAFREGEIVDDGGNEVTLFDATRENVKGLFTCLSGTCGGLLTTTGGGVAAGLDLADVEPLSFDDVLLVAWIGHGNMQECVPGGACIENCDDCQQSEDCDTYFNTIDQNTMICDCEIANWVENADVKRQAWIFATCMAGGVRDDLSDGNEDATVLASCAEDGWDESIYFQADENGIRPAHREWMYLVDSALQQLVQYGAEDIAAGDTNNLVGLDEAFDRSVDAMTTQMVPELENPDVAKCIHLRLAEPSKDVAIFSMDHPYDWSREPSTDLDEPWWNGPDLWVRDSCSCFDEHHVEPVFGQTSYLCGRVHNVGCDDLEDVGVTFSWVESTSWSDEQDWIDIGKALLDIDSAKSKKTPPVEWTDVPPPGSYCLHAVAEVGDDLPQDFRARYDNNVTQANVSVLTVVVEALAWWPFLIENQSEVTEEVALTIDLSRLEDGAEAALEINGIIDMDVPASTSLTEAEGWTTMNFEAAIGEVEAIRMTLPAGARLRSILKMKLPEGFSGTATEILLSQSVDDEEVGGIVFQARVASFEEVACRSLQNLVALLEAIAIEVGDDATVSEISAVASMPMPCQEDGLLALTATIQGLASESLLSAIEARLPPTSSYHQRWVTAVEGFLAVDVEAASEQSLRSLVEGAREQVLYAWLLLPELKAE